MKAIAQRIWNEPAAFLGLLASIALTVGALLTGSDWTWETIVAVLTPLATSLGIRQFVEPEAKKKEAVSPAAEGTTFRPGSPLS